jgi:hypothetical protein
MQARTELTTHLLTNILPLVALVAIIASSPRNSASIWLHGSAQEADELAREDATRKAQDSSSRRNLRPRSQHFRLSLYTKKFAEV